MQRRGLEAALGARAHGGVAPEAYPRATERDHRRQSCPRAGLSAFRTCIVPASIGAVKQASPATARRSLQPHRSPTREPGPLPTDCERLCTLRLCVATVQARASGQQSQYDVGAMLRAVQSSQANRQADEHVRATRARCCMRLHHHPARRKGPARRPSARRACAAPIVRKFAAQISHLEQTITALNQKLEAADAQYRRERQLITRSRLDLSRHV
jgi:hypothetical protein